MIRFHITSSGRKAAEADSTVMINEIQDALDLMANLRADDCECLVLHENNLKKDFFDLRTGFAGEILQKFSNYRFHLAITGDFSIYESKSLKDFIRESNRGKSIIFTATLQEALAEL